MRARLNLLGVLALFVAGEACWAQTQTQEALTLEEFIACVDADGDGTHSASDRFCVEWWLKNGGTPETLLQAANLNSGVADVSSFWSTPSAQLQSVLAPSPGTSSGAAAMMSSCTQFNRGNADGISGISNADAIYILNYLFSGGSAPIPLDAGDTNDDGAIAILDVIFLLDYLFSGGEAPPEPHSSTPAENSGFDPDLGFDPTADSFDPGCEREGLFHWSARPAKPLEDFVVGVSFELTDSSARPDFTIDLDLGTLATALVAVESLNDDILEVRSVTTTGTVVEIQLEDNGNADAFYGYRSFSRRLELHFSGVSQGSYPVSLAGFEATTAGVSATPRLDVDTDTLVVDNFGIPAQAPLGATSGARYSYVLQSSNGDHPVEWSLLSGVLPPNTTLNPNGTISGLVPSGSAGTYSFTVQAEDDAGDTSTATLAINVANADPFLKHATFEDSDSSLSLTTGDKLLLRFSEPMTVASNWQAALSLSAPGNSFGTGATLTVDSTRPSKAVLKLGSGAVLNGVGGTGTDLDAVGGSVAIQDQEGASLSAGSVAILRPRVRWNAGSWKRGQPITPVVLTSPPFPNPGFTIEDLPAGLSFDGQRVTGTPTTAAAGKIVQKNSQGDVIRRIPYRVREPGLSVAPLPSGLTLHPGRHISVEFTTDDPVTPITASIGTEQLLSLPGVGEGHQHFIFPDTAVSGALVFTQGTQSFSLGSQTIQVVTNPNPLLPYIEDVSVWYSSAHVTGLLHIVGTNLSGASFSLAGITVQPVMQGDTFATLPIPAAAIGQQLDVTAQHGGGFFTYVFQPLADLLIELLLRPCPDIESLDIEWTDAVKRVALCKIIIEAMRRQGVDTDSPTRFWRGKWLLIFIARIESNLTARVQTSGGPAKGVFQIEPCRLKDVFLNSGEVTGLKEAILEESELTEEEWEDKLSEIFCDDNDPPEIKNMWPEDGCLCNMMRDNDLLGAIITRGHYRRDPDPATGPDFPCFDTEAEREAYICAIVDDWNVDWKGGDGNLARAKEVVRNELKKWWPNSN